MKKLALVIVASLGFGGMAHAATVSQTVDLLQSGVDVGDVTVIRGGLSTGIRVTVDDGLLTTNNIYQILVRMYNKPQYCATPYDCTASVDLPANGGNTRIEATQFLVAAGAAVATNNLFFGRFYRNPEGVAALPQVIQGNGATNMLDAQFQIEIRNVGVRQQSLVVYDQLTDFLAGGECGVSLTCDTFANSELIEAP